MIKTTDKLKKKEEEKEEGNRKGEKYLPKIGEIQLQNKKPNNVLGIRVVYI